MKHHPKRRQIGTAGLVLRFRDGTCTHQCRRCGQWEAFPRWRAALRSARAHAADHAAGATDRYTLTPAGSRLVGRPQPRWRRSPLRRLAAVLVVLAVLAFTVTVTAVTSRAAPPAPAIGIVANTTAAGPGPEGYRPTPAGPPATDRQGQRIPDPDPTNSTSSAGGGGR
jgi:ferric-dicitrate binding protein FerR (iron transport regulator)